MSVFDIDSNTSQSTYVEGYLIFEDPEWDTHNVFISKVDEDNVYVRGKYNNTIYPNNATVFKIREIGLRTGKTINFPTSACLNLKEDIDFSGVIFNNSNKLKFPAPEWGLEGFFNRLSKNLSGKFFDRTIKNVVVKGCKSTSNVGFGGNYSYLLENVYVENQNYIIWEKNIALKNSLISCHTLRIGNDTSGYSKVKKLAKKGEFKEIKAFLNIPLDCVKFDEITFGYTATLTREQYEAL